MVSVDAAVSKFKTRVYIGNHEGRAAHAALGSFNVRAGTYYTVRRLLPYPMSGYVLRDFLRPLEYQCDERTQLTKSIRQNPSYPDDLWGVREDGVRADDAVRDALAAIESQALPWFDANADLEAVLLRIAPVCWAHARFRGRSPDVFFRNEDLFAALAIRLSRTGEAIALFEELVARPVDPDEQRRYEKEEAGRLRRGSRSKHARLIEPLPHWHAGAVARLHALYDLRARAG